MQGMFQPWRFARVLRQGRHSAGQVPADGIAATGSSAGGEWEEWRVSLCITHCRRRFAAQLAHEAIISRRGAARYAS
jgi:hypothetical protein